MNDDFTRYAQIPDAAAAYRAARADGLKTAACIRMLRDTFDLGLGDAKEVMLVADGVAASRDAHEARFVDDVAAALDD